MAYYERNLPHWLPEGKPVFLTWRLHGSLPLSVIEKLRNDKESEQGKRFVRFDGELDRAAFGPRWLREDKIAEIVQREILELAQRGWYVTRSFVLMPNHVHLLLDPKLELKKITQAIKGRSALACNEELGRQGQPFWQQESFDHWVRNAATFEKIRAYIERNPVSAGLVERPQDWRWSSAHM
jgi:putative transposase